MTTIQVTDKQVIVKGHSGYDVVGKDIVCSAISTLTEATYNYRDEIGNIFHKVENEEDAVFIINIDYISNSGRRILGSFIQMVDDIASQYPDYVRRIKWKN